MPAGRRSPTKKGIPAIASPPALPVYGEVEARSQNENRPKPDVLIGKREWDISYPATALIVRVGSGPQPEEKEPPPRTASRPSPPQRSRSSTSSVPHGPSPKLALIGVAAGAKMASILAVIPARAWAPSPAPSCSRSLVPDAKRR